MAPSHAHHPSKGGAGGEVMGGGLDVEGPPHEARGTGPGAAHGEGPRGGRAVQGLPPGVTIPGHRLPVERIAPAVRPVDQARGEGFWLTPREPTTEGGG